jgi:xRRM domain
MSSSPSTAPPSASLNPSVPPDDASEPVTHTGARANHDQTLTNGPPPYESQPQSRRATIRAAQSPLPPPPSPRHTYPPGCVIFARHVPPDTNKTALRARFSSFLADDHNPTGAAALDYVDYTKGLDSVRSFLLYFYRSSSTHPWEINNSVIYAWRRGNTRYCCCNDSNDGAQGGMMRKKRRSRSSCWMGGERRCIGSACPTRCARSRCSARRRSRLDKDKVMVMMTPCEWTTRGKTHRERLVRESGGNGGDESRIRPNLIPYIKKQFYPPKTPIVQVQVKTSPSHYIRCPSPLMAPHLDPHR